MPAEDKRLRKLVTRYGAEKQWSLIAKHMKTRTETQCRYRWNYSPQPGPRRGKWTAEEDNILIAAHSRLGDQWSEIAKELPGRPDNAVRKRWKSKSLQTKMAAAIQTGACTPMEDGRLRIGECAVDVSAATGVASGVKKELPPAPKPATAQSKAVAPKGASRSKRSREGSSTQNRDESDQGRVEASKRRHVGSQSTAAAPRAPVEGSTSGRPRVTSSNPLYVDELWQMLREEGLV